MNKHIVLQVRDNTVQRSNGVLSYCNALTELFENDNEIQVLPSENYPDRQILPHNRGYKKGVLEKAIQNSGADIVHINGYVNFYAPQAIMIAHKLNKKIVYTAHWHPFRFLQLPLARRLFFYLFLKKKIEKYVDVVVTINNDDTDFFQKVHHNVVRIPHWIRKDISKASNIQKKENMVLFVGRVNGKNKGIEHLYHLPEGKYDIHCVGTGELTLRSDMTHHKNISDEELAVLYQEASVLVVPSTYEAFSYVTLEALCYGTPVVISNGVRIKDYIVDSDYCSVFNYGDYDDFCSQVSKTIGKQVDVNHIKEIFGITAARDKYREVYSF